MRRRRLSLRTKLHLAITGLAACISVFTVYLLFSQAKNALFESTRERLASLAATATLSVDAEAHATLRSRRDESTRAYKQIRNALRQVCAANHPDITRAYTVATTGTSRVWQFVVDTEKAPDQVSHIGDKCDVSRFPDMQLGLSGPSADRAITHDDRGAWVSGYAPLLDSDNRPVGIVGLDMSAEQLVEEMGRLRTSGLMCMGLGIFLSVLLGAVLSSVLMAPVIKLIERIGAAGQGDLETTLDVSRTDELGDVASAFNEMIVSLRESREKLLSQVNTDFLTDLHNHRYFLQWLDEAVRRAKRYGHIVSLLMVDVDDLKKINDTYGHLAGDEVLRQMGQLLRAGVRDVDLVARYGGDQFAIAMPETSTEVAASIAERMRGNAERACFETSSEQSPGPGLSNRIPVTVCIGVASYPQHTAKPDGLIMAAEIALYQAKHLAANRVTAYDTSLQDGSSDPYEVYAFIRNPSLSTMQALAAAVDARDRYTRNHSENVSRYAQLIGRSLNLAEGDLEVLRMAGLLHDIGKIGIPDSILNKSGQLTDEERESIKAHPSVGASIVRNAHSLDAVLPAILHHHERCDGGGYPDGLQGDDIPFLARVIAIADVFDAFTTNRPYRDALSFEEAVQELKNGAGIQFDPLLVGAFLDQVPSLAEELRKAA